MWNFIVLVDQLLNNLDTDPTTHLEFLTSLRSRIPREKSPEAHVLLLSTSAHAKLLYGDLEGTKVDMDEAWKVLDDLDGVDPMVNAAYYSVAADYFKVSVRKLTNSMTPKIELFVTRRKQNMHHITRTLCYI